MLRPKILDAGAIRYSMRAVVSDRQRHTGSESLYRCSQNKDEANKEGGLHLEQTNKDADGGNEGGGLGQKVCSIIYTLLPAGILRMHWPGRHSRCKF